MSDSMIPAKLDALDAEGRRIVQTTAALLFGADVSKGTMTMDEAQQKTLDQLRAQQAQEHADQSGTFTDRQVQILADGLTMSSMAALSGKR